MRNMVERHRVRRVADLAILATTLLVGSFLVACSGPTTPTVAVAGTTIAIPVSGEDPNTGATSLAYGTATIPDPQRGALKVELMLGTTAVATLPVRLVSRVMPDPSSPAGISGTIQGALPVPFTQQVIALVDIPHTVPANTYTIRIERYRDATYAAPARGEQDRRSHAELQRHG